MVFERSYIIEYLPADVVPMAHYTISASGEAVSPANSGEKYHFRRAIRPFSFPVALATCMIGIISAWHEGILEPLNAWVVLLGGLLLQAGVNLINDFADLDECHIGSLSSDSEHRIRRNFFIGMCCFGIAIPIGVWVAFDRDSMQLFGLFVIGLVGALGYTLKPLNYKARGLAVAAVFWLMGVLMVVGSYIAVGGDLNNKIVLMSLPVSCLVSLLLLSNELRDYDSDHQLKLRTLTVRVGYSAGLFLFYVLLITPLILVVIYYLQGWLQHIWLLLPVIFFMQYPARYCLRPAGQRKILPPSVGRVVLVFGIAFCLMLK